MKERKKKEFERKYSVNGLLYIAILIECSFIYLLGRNVPHHFRIWCNIKDNKIIYLYE
jgi:hypothetical protein